MPRYTKEAVLKSLYEHPTPPPEGLREYLEAILNDTLPSYYRRLFQSKKDDYVDELPSCNVRLLINPLKAPRLTQYI